MLQQNKTRRSVVGSRMIDIIVVITLFALLAAVIAVDIKINERNKQ